MIILVPSTLLQALKDLLDLAWTKWCLSWKLRPNLWVNHACFSHWEGQSWFRFLNYNLWLALWEHETIFEVRAFKYSCWAWICIWSEHCELELYLMIPSRGLKLLGHNSTLHMEVELCVNSCLVSRSTFCRHPCWPNRSCVLLEDKQKFKLAVLMSREFRVI